MSEGATRHFIAVIGIVAALWILFFSLFLEVVFGLPLADYIGIVSSSVFSVLIFLVYRRQNDILDAQSDIAETQTQIMEGDHIPILGVERDDFGISGEKPEYDKDSNSLSLNGEQSAWAWFLISNLGNEIAEDIHLRVLLRHDIPESESYNEYTGYSQPLDNRDLISQTNRGEGAVLPPGPEARFMRKNLSITRIRDGVEKTVSFTSGIRTLLQEYNVVTDVGFVLTYKNTHGEEFSMQLDPAYRLNPEDFNGSFDSWDSVSKDYSIKELIEAVDWVRPEER